MKWFIVLIFMFASGCNENNKDYITNPPVVVSKFAKLNGIWDITVDTIVDRMQHSEASGTSSTEIITSDSSITIWGEYYPGYYDSSQNKAGHYGRWVYSFYGNRITEKQDSLYMHTLTLTFFELKPDSIYGGFWISLDTSGKFNTNWVLGFRGGKRK